MASGLSPALRDQLGKLITSRLGLHFPQQRFPELDRGLAATAKELGFRSPCSLVENLLSSPPEREWLDVLAGNLTVGETYFYRDSVVFQALEQEVLPKLIWRRRENRSLRIWSAGCATGEEPYSIAILLRRLLPDVRNWNITILATDINSRFLKKASRAVYGEWSFRNAPAWIKGTYFKRTGEGRFELRAEYRAMVTLAHHNLAEDSYPSLTNNTSAMDVILCRNVLMYFTPEIALRAVQGLYRCIVDGGCLVVSPCEMSLAASPDISTTALSGAPIYQKPEQRLPRTDTRGLRSGAASESSVPRLAQPVPDLSRKRTTHKADRLPTSKPDARPSPDAAAHTAAARRLYESGRYKEAEERILHLVRNREESSELMALLARVYANQGNLSLAAEWSARAIAADKMNSGNHYLHAAVLEEQGRTEEAAQSLKRALYADPNFVLAHFSLGNLLRRQGHIRESKRYLRNALALSRAHRREDVLAGSEGLTAGRLVEIILASSGEDEGHGA